jgi:spore coat protein H
LQHLRRVKPGHHALALLCAALGACGQRSQPSASTDPSPDGGGTPLEQPFAMPALQGSLPVYDLDIPQSALDLFEADLWAPEQPATFRAGGVTLPMRVELRGASARTFPKKSWNVDLGEGRYEGRRRLKLIAEFQDGTMMVEKLAYDLLAGAGVEAPRGRYVRLNINGVYQGVYLDLEAVDKSFLRAHGFADDDASIYRCGWWNCEMKTWDAPYQGGFEKRTNETEPWDDVHELVRAINHTPEPELARELAERMDLEGYLRAMAVDALVSNNYIQDSESFLVNDRVRRKWWYVPWDLNNADARWWIGMSANDAPISRHPLVVFTVNDPAVATIYERRAGQVAGVHPTFSNLTTRIVYEPALLARYLALVERGLDEVFRPEVLDPWLDEVHALLDRAMREDPWIDQEKWASAADFLKRFVRERGTFVRSEIARLRARSPGVVLEVVDPQAGTLELRNRGSEPAEIGGMVLTTNLRAATTRNVPARQLAPGERLALRARDVGLTLAEAGEVGLFDGISLTGAVDVLFYGKLAPGSRYERAEDGRWAVR